MQMIEQLYLEKNKLLGNQGGANQALLEARKNMRKPADVDQQAFHKEMVKGIFEE